MNSIAIINIETILLGKFVGNMSNRHQLHSPYKLSFQLDNFQRSYAPLGGNTAEYIIILYVMKYASSLLTRTTLMIRNDIVVKNMEEIKVKLKVKSCDWSFQVLEV